MATNKHSIKGYIGTVGTVTGISEGGALDISELSAAVVDVAADSVAILDATDSSTKKEAIADIVSGVAGTGLAAASGQLSLDIDGCGDATLDVAADTIAFIDEDASGDPTKLESVADLMTAVAGEGLIATSGVLSLDIDEFGDAVLDPAADTIPFIDESAEGDPGKLESVADFVSAIAGTAATTGISNTSGVLSAAIKIAHLVADEKSAIFIETGAFDFSGSADAVDTKVIDSMAAKGQLLFAVLVVSQVANGTTSNVISISSAAGANTKMATDMTLTIANAFQNTVGAPIFMWPVVGANGIVASGGDVYLYAAASAGRSTGAVNYILVFRKSS